MKKESLSAVLLLCFWPLYCLPQDRPVAFTHAVVIDGNGGTPIEDGTVVIRSKKVEAVGSSSGVQIPSNARVTDLRGKALMPGLADMHVHLTGGWDGVAVDYLGYQRYLNALLYSGVTAVLDTGNVQPLIVQLRDEIAAGRLVGPRIYCAGPLIDGADPAWPPISYSVSSLDQIPRLVRQLKQDRIDIIKAYGGLSDRMIRALVDEGRKQELPVFVDQGRRNGSPDLVLTGIAAFAHLPTDPLNKETINLFKERGVMFMTTLATTESFARRRLGNLDFLSQSLIQDTSPPSFLDDLRTEASRTLSLEENVEVQGRMVRLKQQLVNAKTLFDAGVLIAAGTDAPYPGVSQGEGIHHELELLVESGLRPLDVIRIATRNAAELLKVGSQWGTIEPGKLANLIVVNGRPDRRIADTRNIELVVQEGRIIDREKLKLDPTKDPGFRPVSPVSAVK
jgi:imidazolonepropionase-like amidohydrolase